MKSLRILGFEIQAGLSVYRVKRLVCELPDWAIDTCITTSDIDGNSIPHKIKYYKGIQRHYIDLPECRRVVQVSLTPKYEIVDGVKLRTTNRKLIIDLFI